MDRLLPKSTKVLVLALALLLSAAALIAADATGTWTASFDTQVGVQNYTYTFKVDGRKLTGHAKSQFGESDIQEGSVTGDEISFVENLTFQDQPIRIEYKGKVTGDEIQFTRKVGDVATETFSAKRAK